MSTGRPSWRREAIRPPTRRTRSTSSTGTPAAASTRAQATPEIPAPTMVTGRRAVST